jgi:integrase
MVGMPPAEQPGGKRELLVSTTWLQVAGLVVLVGFFVLVLRDYLVEHRMRSDRRGSALIFGNTAATPFTPNMLQRRADQTWKEAGLERITPHSCRHTLASLMIAAGVNAKALSTFMGHAKIGITLDRYGHLMPGSEEEAASLLDSHLVGQRESAEKAARGAGAGLTGELTGEQLANRN